MEECCCEELMLIKRAFQARQLNEGFGSSVGDFNTKETAII